MAGRHAGKIAIVEANRILPLNQITEQLYTLKRVHTEITINIDTCLEWMAINYLLKKQCVCERCDDHPFRTLIKSTRISENDGVMWRCITCKSKKIYSLK